MTAKKIAPILLVQLLLVCIGFNKVVFHPNSELFCNSYDGIKNYFNFYAYITDEKLNDGLLKYNSMNHPYGDYVFYTDNTPALSVPLKWVDSNLIDLDGCCMAIYNYFFLFGVLLSSLLAYLIAKRFVGNYVLLLALSVAWAWINPQVTRFFSGTVNLTLSWVLLLAVYLLLLYHEQSEQKNARSTFAILFLLSAHIIFASFLHLYYLAIVGLTALFFFSFYALSKYKQPKQAAAIFLSGMVAVGVAAAVVMLCIQLSDAYYDFRKPAAEGYDWDEWKLQLSAIFSHYRWTPLPFPVTANGITYESHAYFGGFVLYGVFLLGFGLKYFTKGPANHLGLRHQLLQTQAGRFLTIMLLCALMCFLIALGEVYTFGNGQFKLYNYLNPFYTARKFTDLVTQFRCLARFSWICFWAVNLLVAFWLDQALKNNKSTATKIVAGAMLFLLIADTYGTISYMNRHGHARNSLTNHESTGEIKKLSENVDFGKYQAIVTIPYYHVGSENYGYTLSPATDWFAVQSFQLSLMSGLPLMSSKMSRTAEYQAKALVGLFLDQKPDADLLSRLSNKPVLVLYNTHIFDDYMERPKRQPALNAYNNGAKMPEKYHMQEIASLNHLKLYEWEVDSLKNKQ